jgi:hypothetical protein
LRDSLSSDAICMVALAFRLLSGGNEVTIAQIESKPFKLRTVSDFKLLTVKVKRERPATTGMGAGRERPVSGSAGM